MNKDLGLTSIVKSKKPNYEKVQAHRIFPNLLNQDFTANRAWCTDFTYLFLTDGLILHSDQGSQYTSKDFTDFCASINVQQSMSKAGCPYDNAPMERYYNTLKNELIYHHYYNNDGELSYAINNFSYIWYNHLRPHTFNGGLTPFETRYKSKNIRLKCYKNA